jgi:hypothetical protein
MSISREENRPPMIIVDGEPTICEELSLPELKALQKQHNIVLNGHYNKKELVELLKQRGVLPAITQLGEDGSRIINLPIQLVSEESKKGTSPPRANKYTPKANIRGRARRVELTLLDDETFQPTESQVFPSLYKAAKFLGTFSSVMTHFDGRWYKSKIDGKMYRVTILDPVLA